MHPTAPSVIAFAATIVVALHAAALISWQEPAEDPASAVGALAVALASQPSS